MSFLLRWSWLLLLGAIAGAAPMVYLFDQTATFESEAIVLVRGDNGLEASERLTNTFADLAKVRSALSAIKNSLDLVLTEAELDDKINVTTSFESQLIRISVEDEDPALAARIANTTAEEFVARVNAEFTTPPPPLPPDAPAPVVPDRAQIIEVALPADEESGSTLMSAGLAGALGVLIAGSIAVGVESLWGSRGSRRVSRGDTEPAR